MSIKLAIKEVTLSNDWGRIEIYGIGTAKEIGRWLKKYNGIKTKAEVHQYLELEKLVKKSFGEK